MFEIKQTNNTNTNHQPTGLSVNKVLDESNVLLQISSRAVDPNNTTIGQLHVFDQAKLARLAENMPEINRATKSFGRSNSQTSDKLMSLTMISYSPYRYLHQCLAKIESRRSAIKENQYRLRKSQIEIAQLQLKKDQLSNQPNFDKSIQLEIDLLDIELEEKIVNLNDSMLYLEGALKEIAVYQDAYNQIKKNHNIPDNWDELDFEQSEIEHHIKSAFNNGIRDILSTGRLNNGTLEYMHQFGINPITAQTLIGSYIEDANDMIRKQNQYPSIEHLNQFLDHVYIAFKDTYKDQMRRIGLDELITTDGLYLDNNIIL
jgi:hypothetical protein